MLKNFNLYTNDEYTEKAQKEVQSKRGSDIRRSNFKNLFNEKLSSNIYNNGSQNSTDSDSDFSSNSDFDLESFRIGYSKELNMLLNFYDNNENIFEIFNSNFMQYI